MENLPENVAVVENVDCGCVIYKGHQGETVRYKPCLGCALQNAGVMLQEAAQRIRELREKGLLT